MSNVKTFGRVTLQRSQATGLWAWIENSDCDLLCEVSAGFNHDEATDPIYKDARKAYDWAIEQNNRVDDGETVSRQEIHDEWNHHYYQSLGV